ncbi:hypothetical protein [Halospeciosus flavus]|uniref:Uncharacterized protein n=1 Tax=Halospeciosus flavus TaxID=3032283 RepID=A0ABD5Z7I6_9EURY|nr:hypothetical protein [Halospeciosus flavus]
MATPDVDTDERDPVYATHPLVEVLCELAADADPRPLTVALATTAAGDLDASPDSDLDSDQGRGDTPLADLDPETPVFSDFYFPGAGETVKNVFGVDLATPAGGTQGRFLSHPKGDREPGITDDFAARLLVAVPPWGPENVRAFTRDGDEHDLVLVAGSAPETRLD